MGWQKTDEHLLKLPFRQMKQYADVDAAPFSSSPLPPHLLTRNPNFQLFIIHYVHCEDKNCSSLLFKLPERSVCLVGDKRFDSQLQMLVVDIKVTMQFIYQMYC